MTTENATSGIDQERSTARTDAQARESVATGWESFYGLGWIGTDGRPHLTSWDSDRPVVSMLSVDCAPHRIPLCNAVVPPGARLIPVPTDAAELDELVRMRCGRKVIGWQMEAPFERKPWNGGR